MLNIIVKSSLAIALAFIGAACAAPTTKPALSNDLPQRLSFDVPVDQTSLTAKVTIGANELAPKAFLDEIAGSYTLRLVDTPVGEERETRPTDGGGNKLFSEDDDVVVVRVLSVVVDRALPPGKSLQSTYEVRPSGDFRDVDAAAENPLPPTDEPSAMPFASVESNQLTDDLGGATGVVGYSIGDTCKQSTAEFRLVPFTNKAEFGITRNRVAKTTGVADVNAWIPLYASISTPTFTTLGDHEHVFSQYGCLRHMIGAGVTAACPQNKFTDVWSAKMICTF